MNEWQPGLVTCRDGLAIRSTLSVNKVLHDESLYTILQHICLPSDLVAAIHMRQPSMLFQYVAAPTMHHPKSNSASP